MRTTNFLNTHSPPKVPATTPVPAEPLPRPRVQNPATRETRSMDSNSRGILLGAFLGVLFVIGVVAAGIDWGAQTIQTAALPIDAPIMFQPK